LNDWLNKMDKLKQISEQEIQERLNHFINLRWKEKLKWLVNLRWIAILGLFIVITGVRYVLKIELPLFHLYLGNLVLFFYNILFFFYSQRFESGNAGGSASYGQFFKKANHFANLQISLDLILLTYLIHFSGAAENPFIFYFVFHMVIASILLSNQAAYLQATLAVLLLGSVIAGECLKILPHYHLIGFIPMLSAGSELCLHPGYMTGIFSVFATTLYITVYFATTIVNRLRKEEKEIVIVNKKLEEQDRLKSQYVQMVSHDLQSSLSTIQSCLKVVLSDLTGEISEKSREMVARAEQRSRYLLHFVKDLLDLSKMRATKEMDSILLKKSISLSETIENVVEQLKPVTEGKKLLLSVENSAGSSLIPANPDAMEQLLVNLIGNAIKYTPWGGKITVASRPSIVDGFVQMCVEDTGIGISQEDLPHIFEDFYRAKNAVQMEKDGTGLGLSIVKQIVNSHGGEIWVESQVGKGSRFFITLPKAKE